MTSILSMSRCFWSRKDKVAGLKRRFLNLYAAGALDSLKSDDERALCRGKRHSGFDPGDRILSAGSAHHSFGKRIRERLFRKIVSTRAARFLCRQFVRKSHCRGVYCVRKDKNSPVELRRAYASDTGSRFKLFQEVKSAYPDSAMQVYLSSVDMDRKALLVPHVWKR